MKIKIAFTTLLTLCIMHKVSLCQTPTSADVITYQGRLVENGSPVEGSRNMSFKLYPDLALNIPIWDSGQMSVSVIAGIFNVELAIDKAQIYSLNDLYLGIEVDNIEIQRAHMSSVVYAMRSSNSDNTLALQGNPISDQAPNDNDALKWNAATKQWEPDKTTAPTVVGSGLSYNQLDDLIGVEKGNLQDIITTEIDIPAAGFILVQAHGQVKFSNLSSNTSASIAVQIDETKGGKIEANKMWQNIGFENYSVQAGSNTVWLSFSIQRVIEKNAPGQYEIRLEAQDSSGGRTVKEIYHPTISAVYIPTALGKVVQ